MTKATQEENYPPALRKTANGEIDVGSLASLLEWFLTFDGRVALVRHPHVEELFQWKQADDAAQGIEVYPFENAESRSLSALFRLSAKTIRKKNCKAGFPTHCWLSANPNKPMRKSPRNTGWKKENLTSNKRRRFRLTSKNEFI